MAVLHSHFGNGGGPGYLAVLALSGIGVIFKPVVLALTVPVALVVAIKAYRSEVLTWRMFWPFGLGSIAGNLIANLYLTITPFTYRALVILLLLFAMVRFLFGIGLMNEEKTKPAPIWIAIPAGAVIGLFAGTVGIGGGVFLSPLVLIMRWAKTQEAVGIVAPFVLLNSLIAFLLSQPLSALDVPQMLYWLPAALIGAWVGSELDMRMFPAEHLGKALSIILGLAALRLIL